MTIALIGFMGCGKSSVGRQLSSLLCRPFVDLDAEIVSRSGMTVSQWFDTKGESAFRECELQTLLSVMHERSDVILSVGGGTPTIAAAADILRKETICVYLKASAEQLEKILSVLDNRERPLLKLHTVEELLSERERMYESIAAICVRLSDYADGVPDENVFHSIAVDIRDTLSQ